MSEEYIELPPERLSEEILEAVIEEFVTREGTEYGHQEFSLQQKVEQVKSQLSDGSIALIFDPVSESCTLLSREQLNAR